MRRLGELREVYRKAELRLRLLLFGDTESVAGRLKGDEARQQAALELRRMRNAFGEVADQAEKTNLPDDLRERAIEERDKLSDHTRQQGS
jgi:hypothetical protein